MRYESIVAMAAVLAFVCGAFAQDAAKWEKTIQGFEAQDTENPPAPGGILFIGSSSIRFWDTDAAFPESDALNRGFGGSQMSDVLAYMDRIVFPYAPRLIVLYEGDNDIAAGKSPESIIAETKSFIETVHAKLPETKIVYISIKPSLLRWNMMEKMRVVNAAIKEIAQEDSLLEYVDVDTPMIGDDGTPRKELFIKDGLHMNAEGYALWNDLVRPHLETATVE